MRFIYILVGWEDSVADSRVLRDAITRPIGLKIPRENYYLVDSGYNNGEGFLSPYRLLLMDDDDGSKGVRRRGVKQDGKLSRRVWSTAEEEALLEYLREIVRNPSHTDQALRGIHMTISASHFSQLTTLPTNPLKLHRRPMSPTDKTRLQYSVQVSIGPSMPSLEVFDLECFRPALRSWFHSCQTYVQPNSMDLTFLSVASVRGHVVVTLKPHSILVTTNTINVKDDVFDNFTKINSFAKTLRYKLYPYYAQWSEVFGKDRATGERGLGPIIAPRNPCNTIETEHSENVPVMPEYYVPTPNPSLYGDDDEFMNSFASATTPANVNRADTERVSSRKQKMVVIDIYDKFDEKFEAFCYLTDHRLGDIAKHLAWRLKNFKLLSRCGVSLNRFLIRRLKRNALFQKELVKNKADLDLFLTMSTAGKETFVKMLASSKV
ncbi:UNVERIFIED_CONTAM: hypothetical protein Scaly_0075200 [Sesamum calycinum]|uniref:DDE Tnp4 domain-containing protein n=1 Tax=Sesamum calycinum TaxID=2727403 RepID=A0AAW2SV02_9LAMI